MTQVDGWNFRKMTRAELSADPVEGQFFTPQGLANMLVREAVQNSLDAREGDGPVRVRFSFPDSTASAASSRKPYLDGLVPHLNACGIDATDVGSGRLLVIEDFGTRGLRGDPQQEDDLGAHLGAPKNDFFMFWRNIGRSRKSDHDRGRWGLGKTVFPASSRINAFFGLTVRQDGRALLMGQSALKVHAMKEKRRCPYGYFASFDGDDFAIPFEDSTQIAQFRTAFGVTRQKEPGLSLVVPCVRDEGEEIRSETLLRAAALYYYYPILAGELIVEVAAAAKTITLDAGSLEGIVGTLDWTKEKTSATRLQKLFELARCSIDTSVPSLTLIHPGLPTRPEWKPELFPAEKLDELRDRYESGDVIALEVPLTVRRRVAGPQKIDEKGCRFHILLQRDSSASKGDEHYIRQGLTISGIRTLNEAGVRGMVVIADDSLSALLGDAENPAHTEWQERAEKLKEHYELGPTVVRFVRQSLRGVVEILSRPPEGRDENLLRDVFFLDMLQQVPGPGPGEDEKKKKKKKPIVKPPRPGRGPQPRRFRIERTSGGFRLLGEPDVDPPASIDVRMAYAVREGDPFARYTPFDFRLDRAPITITRTDLAQVDERGGNVLKLRPASRDFVVEVTGFDERRDLVVRATPTSILATGEGS